MSAFRYEIWVDRGGTFTDCLAFDRATGKLSVAKVPSSDRATLDGIRALLGVPHGEELPACDVRLSTTIATNALLERRGVPSALAITRGFGDLLRIGDQTRPDLFALAIERAEPLPQAVLEVDARALPDGTPALEPDLETLAEELAAVRAQGIDSLGVVVLNDYARGALERRVAGVAERAGFAYVTVSSELSPELGFLARAETTALDAYLTPLVRDRLARLERDLPGSRVRVMQSSGELTTPARLRGPGALLSGPAGGVVACARIAADAGLGAVLGFDMGGTSTDVCRSDGGRLERRFESTVAGVRVRAPVLAVATVAAGGGSICRFDGRKLTVGPESAGAVPGPLCYGRPEATALTLTDVNLVLGRLAPDRFPFPLDAARARAGLEQVRDELARAGHAQSLEEIGAGFLEIANRTMADAIREVSVSAGHDPRQHALVVLGGAGGQHACALARHLGIERIVFHPLAGVLAAFGLGLCDVGHRGVRELGSARLDPEGLLRAERALNELESIGRTSVLADEGANAELGVTRDVELRYVGTETSLLFTPESAETLRTRFDQRHRELFGHARPGHPVEIVCARVAVVARRPTPAWRGASAPPPTCVTTTRLHAGGRWHEAVPVYDREALPAGATLRGPLVIREATGTIVLDPGFVLELEPSGLLSARPDRAHTPARTASLERADPVLLEVLGRRFMSIAEQMGYLLRRTALSTNIRERLDFSCALFDARANLVANAPHIPVHLGAMSESVRACVAAHPDLEPGDVFVTNDPAHGGSHLPDITVVTPVHAPDGALLAFTACRGHHADVGGKTPGSMPPDSVRLEEEGVVIGAVRAVRAGELDERALFAALTRGPYPARHPSDNLADLRAQIAAVRAGARLFGESCAELGRDVVLAYLDFIQDDAAGRVEDWIATLPPGERRFEDALDDGARLRVGLRVHGRRLTFDFTGSAPEQRTNLNAPRSVTNAAVLYALRALTGAAIPLNGGCLRPVELVVPAPSLLAAGRGAAVAAGNVETSQRVVDVLLGAAAAAAASQGTMNNLSFGDATFGYYETLGGGAGAGPGFHGASAVHCHMTNTRLTDPEVLERRFPVRVLELSIRRGSGGDGQFRGGDGLCRELELLAPLRVSFIGERHVLAPFGLAGGAPGLRGRTLFNGVEQGGRFSLDARAGDRLRVETPGGGGYGAPSRV
ncbi:MAG TPA: hydantoinase B/oxoprolinase family protein [Polyangiaceae bacterium]|nr:hydantoinase B/oxoprolinase family protein [Polyangiaceae bacterium]